MQLAFSVLPFCRLCEPVTAGKVIGYCCSPGVSTGSHLHFDLMYDGARRSPWICYIRLASPAPTAAHSDFCSQSQFICGCSFVNHENSSHRNTADNQHRKPQCRIGSVTGGRNRGSRLHRRLYSRLRLRCRLRCSSFLRRCCLDRFCLGRELCHNLHITVRHGELAILDGHTAADDLPLPEVIAYIWRSCQGAFRTRCSGGGISKSCSVAVRCYGDRISCHLPRYQGKLLCRAVSSAVLRTEIQRIAGLSFVQMTIDRKAAGACGINALFTIIVSIQYLTACICRTGDFTLTRSLVSIEYRCRKGKNRGSLIHAHQQEASSPICRSLV